MLAAQYCSNLKELSEGGMPVEQKEKLKQETTEIWKQMHDASDGRWWLVTSAIDSKRS